MADSFNYETLLDFSAIHAEMHNFHDNFHKLPNTIILPAEMTGLNKERISDILGMREIYGAVKKPTLVFELR